MPLLGVVGIVAGIILWQTGHPWIGLLVGFLFGLGAGWVLLFNLFSLVRLALNPRGRRNAREFNLAWEQRVGGRPDDVTRAMFRQWCTEKKRGSTQSAAHFLDQKTGLIDTELVETPDGDAIVVRYPDGASEVVPTDDRPRPPDFEATVGAALTRRQLREGAPLWMPQYRVAVEGVQGELNFDDPQ